MAPTAQDDSTSNPLADYFFIAGIESTQIFDERNITAGPPPVETTIEEDRALVTDGTTSPRPATPGSPTSETPARKSKRYSWDARKSIGSIINLADDAPSPASNRSSTTIKVQTPGNANVLTEEDFEQALRKFATERDSFLEDVHLQAGTVTTAQPRAAKARPKTIRIMSDDSTNGAAGLRGGVGSLRRKLSTMNRRRSTTPSRQSSVLTSKRLSNYKSVIPTPEPFKVDPATHPLKRRYEPVLLDRYPTKAMTEESKRRCAFPDYIPMFAFPNDVSVVASDQRPRSTWHAFAMTTADGSRIFNISVTLWLPLGVDAANELEQQCEIWRQANMTVEEREMANSLGERLAGERAKLSRLLSRLPTLESESEERDQLEDDISALEERIAMMADLLRPVRHAAASKIEGLTESETGFWVPRVYGLIGHDQGLTAFWKEWLKAVIVPMTDGAILNVPASSPKVGMWQPLERYVVNMCVEAPSPLTSITQIEVAIRELRLYARKEAINELPGSRNIDIYALFRALSIPNIVMLFEYAVLESRIIFLSSHGSMLHLACAALVNLLYPLKWTGVYIPIIPARLLQALEAPCPYIIGVEKRFDNVNLPNDDVVIVDLDLDQIEASAPAQPLPRQIRRKLTALLQAAAPHHNRFGVPKGPPPYAIETYPNNHFSSENPQVFDTRASKSGLAAHVNLSSSSFADPQIARPSTPIFNAFLNAKGDPAAAGERRPSLRPGTSSTNKSSFQAPPSPTISSPMSGSFPPTPVSRSDSAFGLQTTLREKRSGQSDTTIRRSSSVSKRSEAKQKVSQLMSSQFGLDRINPLRRPSQPFVGGHSPSLSTSALSMGPNGGGYAPSIYAPSTLAASTIMPMALIQPVRDTDSTKWVEGHCMIKRNRPNNTQIHCTICNEKCPDEAYHCNGCTIKAHAGCVPHVVHVCPVAFRPDLVRAAFVRCFASLLYTYRRFLHAASGDRKKSGLIYHFNLDGFIKSCPGENAEYLELMRETVCFNEFIHERETKRSEDPAVKLFDEIILSKRNRGKTALFSKSDTSFLSDTSDHLWRSAAAAAPSSRFPGDYRQVVSRIPAKLDPSLMKEPRSNQGAPRIPKARTQRKPIPSMLGLKVDTPGLLGTENLDPAAVGNRI